MKYPIWPRRSVPLTRLSIIATILASLCVTLVLGVAYPTYASSSLHPLKKGSGGYTQELLRLAWDISPDPNWIMTIEAESGWRIDAVSPTGDYGLCQLNRSYHRRFIESEGFKDPRTQLLYCASVYANAASRGRLQTTFYGYNVRLKTKNNFIWN